MLRPIIDYQPEAKSPPLAPKHLVAPIPGRPPNRKQPVPATDVVVATPSHPKGTVRRVIHHEAPPSEHDASVRGSDDGTGTPSPSESSSTSPTPPPLQDGQSVFGSSDHEDNREGRGQLSPRRRRAPAHAMEVDSDDDVRNGQHEPPNYCDEILEYFISDSSQIPQFLVNPPPDYDANMAIDDDGHTALHWASAMGRIRVVKLLLTAGADIFKVNKTGQTALMRSVMFSNNYDVRKFPELYELLHRSTLNIDHLNRTVFHHIVDVAMAKGKAHAARYYMETILQRLAEYPKELADIINFQDEEGETALTMAARCRSKRLVKLLIDHGADPKVANRDCKTAEDYILEDERFRSSPILPSRSANMSYRHLHAGQGPSGSTTSYSKPPLHHSVTAQIASTQGVNDMATMLESLAASFDQELKDKERDQAQAHSLLGSIQSEILESKRSVAQLKQQCHGFDETKEKLLSLEEGLELKMKRRYRQGWEKWLKEEEERETIVRQSELGKSLPSLPIRASANAPSVPTSDGLGDISDLQALYRDLPDPTDEDAIAKACAELRQDLEARSARRNDVFHQLVRLEAEAGTGGRMNQYRRLISGGCGGISPEEVDGVLSMLVEVCVSILFPCILCADLSQTLEAEEPSASTITWSSNGAKVGGS